MPFINNPLRRNWNQISEDLNALQEVVDLYKKRFECAGRSEIAEKLEGCVLALIGAEGVAKALAVETQKLRVAHGEVERGRVSDANVTDHCNRNQSDSASASRS